jgi:hypothetical protein
MPIPPPGRAIVKSHLRQCDDTTRRSVVLAIRLPAKTQNRICDDTVLRWASWTTEAGRGGAPGRAAAGRRRILAHGNRKVVFRVVIIEARDQIIREGKLGKIGLVEMSRRSEGFRAS